MIQPPLSIIGGIFVPSSSPELNAPLLIVYNLSCCCSEAWYHSYSGNYRKVTGSFQLNWNSSLCSLNLVIFGLHSLSLVVLQLHRLLQSAMLHHRWFWTSLVTILMFSATVFYLSLSHIWFFEILLHLALDLVIFSLHILSMVVFCCIWLLQGLLNQYVTVFFLLVASALLILPLIVWIFHLFRLPPFFSAYNFIWPSSLV